MCHENFVHWTCRRKPGAFPKMTSDRDGLVFAASITILTSTTAYNSAGEKRQEQKVIVREIQTKCFIVVTSEDSS